MKKIKSFKLFESSEDTNDIKSIVMDMLLELDFLDIETRVDIVKNHSELQLEQPTTEIVVINLWKKAIKLDGPYGHGFKPSYVWNDIKDVLIPIIEYLDSEGFIWHKDKGTLAYNDCPIIVTSGSQRYDTVKSKVEIWFEKSDGSGLYNRFWSDCLKRHGIKEIKSYNRFMESKSWDLSIIKDMLLDYTDGDVSVDVSDGVWSHTPKLQKNPLEYVKIVIGRPFHRLFKIEPCLLDVIDYLEDCGLFLMKDSWYWNDRWQHYIGCPNCSSDDILDAEESGGVFTTCTSCGYVGDPDRFLLDRWPVTRLELVKDIKGRQVEQIELLFSVRKSLYNESLNQSFDQVEVDEIKSTVSDMLLELQFDNIRSGVWVLSDKMVQVELRKSVKDRDSAVLWGDSEVNRSFEWSDVEGVVDSVSEYLSGWGFLPYWDEPKFEVKANWGGDEATDLSGYDTCLYLRWKGGGQG
jgi:hypothetical protein